MKHRADPSAGFTLLELLVVMGIMGLVLATAIAARPRTAVARVAVAARGVVAMLQLARAQAMSSNADTIFRIDTQARQFGVAGFMHTLPRGMGVALTVAETELKGDSGGLRFYPDGQSSGGEIVLALDGRSARITVSWLTGEAQLSQ